MMSFLLSITVLSYSRVVFFMLPDIGAEIAEWRDLLDLSLLILLLSEFSLDL